MDKYEIKCNEEAEYPWEVWCGEKCLKKGLRSKGVAHMEKEILEGIDKLKIIFPKKGR